MHKFYKHKFYKKYKDEIWGKLILSDNFSYNKKSVLTNYKQKIIRRFIRLKSKYSYYRKGFLKNLRRATFLTRLVRKNSRFLSFSIKRINFLLNRKVLRLKKRFKPSLRWKNRSYYKLRRRFFSKKYIMKKYRYTNKVRKNTLVKGLFPFKAFLITNFNLVFSKKVKKKLFLNKTLVYNLSNSNVFLPTPSELIIRKKFLYLNNLSFLIKKKFNLKNNKSFFYSVHVASPQKKIKKWSNFGLKMIYYKKVSLFFGFKKVSSFVDFYSKSSKFWGDNEFFLFSLLERRLETFILRCNFINSVYFIKKFIESGNVMINNVRCTNPSRVLALGEIVSINKLYKKTIYYSMKSRLLKKKVLLNNPDFAEIDYKLLVGMVIRPPSSSSLTKPVSFDLYTTFLSINNN